MDTIADIVVRSGEISLLYFWMPFLIWTLAGSLILLMLKLIRISQPLYHYHFRLALLFSLPLIFVCSPYISFTFIDSTRVSVEAFTLAGQSGTEILPAETSPPQTAYQPAWIPGILIIIACIPAFWCLLKLILSYRKQEEFRRSLVIIDDPFVNRLYKDMKNIVLPGRKLELRESRHISSPLTFGWYRPVIVLPSVEYDHRSLSCVFLHEMVHIRRGDYFTKCLQEIIRSVFTVNPLVQLLSREADDYREMSCDAEVLSYNTTTPGSYAMLLLACAGKQAQHNDLYSLMSQPKSKLKQRIAAMNTYPSTHRQKKSMRVLSCTFSGMMAVSIIFLSACDFSGMPANEQTELKIYQDIEGKPEPVDGLKAIYENLIYPDGARRSHTQGQVVVQFTVDTDGTVKDAEVLNRVSDELDQMADNIIRNSEWIPGQQEGRSVPVQMVYSVTFRISDGNRQAYETQDFETVETDMDLVVVGYGG
ncbi:MAG: M56 family metallopeptidase [Balneolales bacterium]